MGKGRDCEAETKDLTRPVLLITKILDNKKGLREGNAFAGEDFVGAKYTPASTY